jgi:hypothetical protein
MPKLHEILAVESGLQTAAKKINEETIKTFGKKDEHFVEMVRDVKHFAEEDAKLDTNEAKAMVTTVFDKLLYTVQPNVRALDAYMQKEATNQKAAADIIVGDAKLATDVPATVLLGLETKLTELRTVYEAIPTLAPGPTWEPDADRRKTGGVYRSVHPDVTFRTKKTMKPIIMAPATDHHPAQVQAIQEDVPVARITTQYWSGMITSAQKSDLLGRVDRLLRAVKRARQRANATEVEKRTIGRELFDFIHEGIVA